MKQKYFLALALFAFVLSKEINAQTSPAITLRLDQPGHAVSPKLYGLMTEEINYSYDGGLYAELIRNRVFKDNPMAPDHWSLLQEGGAQGKISLDRQNPVNTALTICLKLEVQNAGSRIGIANDGYWGIPVRPKTTYSASFYAKASQPGLLAVSIESNDGKTVYAKAQSQAIGSEWKQYKLTLNTADNVTPTADTRFVISTIDTGRIWFNLVSLFPPTYNNTPNGNRPDIMQLLAGMKPAFLRFPGGNYLEGDYFTSRFDWKKTIGSLDQRPGHASPWGYRSSDGMGLYEFLKWCEDVKMEPLLAVFAGYTLKADYFDDPKFLQPFVDEALEEIEYIIGDKSTKWGAMRARDGHPDPFSLTYVEIGNEDGFDRSGSYEKRFNQFAAAIRSKYPQLKIISTVGGKNDFLSSRFPIPKENPDVVDEHFYRNSIEMQDMANLYDNYDRNGPKIFVGEWATREGFPTTNFNSALGDAAFLTGLERNSDLVIMSCYAPLFVNVNPGGMQWKSDLIGYNTLTSYGSPSYHVQKMFNHNLGDQVVMIDTKDLPTQIKKPNARDSAAGRPPKTIPAMFFSATKDTKTGLIYLKVVNATSGAQNVNIDLKGSSSVASQGTVITIKADNPEDTNTITGPEKIVPSTTKVKGLGKSFQQIFPAYSVTVLQLQTK
ncbi:MAG: alpha-L-arabinofuranosidase C-terminal domain-containing protein [Bacteroidota bacterium]|nr:alpha-L-arabinofuranosidase C-terminal domain-containing protein [Bacteroidota bacterium]